MIHSVPKLAIQIESGSFQEDRVVRCHPDTGINLPIGLTCQRRFIVEIIKRPLYPASTDQRPIGDHAMAPVNKGLPILPSVRCDCVERKELTAEWRNQSDQSLRQSQKIMLIGRISAAYRCIASRSQAGSFPTILSLLFACFVVLPNTLALSLVII